MATLQQWLAPHLAGARSRTQLQKLPWLDIFKSQVSEDTLSNQPLQILCFGRECFSIRGCWRREALAALQDGILELL
jgi:hypothetical protein